MAANLKDGLVQRLKVGLPKLSRQKVSLLARELVAVAVGVRAATLIDSIMLSEDDASMLAQALRQDDRSLLTVHEPESGQTVVINRDILAQRKSSRQSIFVEVGGTEPVVLDEPPNAIESLLDQILHTSALDSFMRLSLPYTATPRSLIPLVGYLLDYPVAYCLDLSPDGRNCLGACELVLVEAVLLDGDDESHLLSFSYPALLHKADQALDPTNVCAQLESELVSRLKKTSMSDRCSIQVAHRSITLDQVAL
ncbi:uncharacterized protein JCM15063_003355 [Sporobolomyces koalae]|uniref:uncharacterized protein n=1 Tax=Sporobolomyces koalae TaxID=500713 RepID=UPI003171CB57